MATRGEGEETRGRAGGGDAGGGRQSEAVGAEDGGEGRGGNGRHPQNTTGPRESPYKGNAIAFALLQALRKNNPEVFANETGTEDTSVASAKGAKESELLRVGKTPGDSSSTTGPDAGREDVFGPTTAQLKGQSGTKTTGRIEEPNYSHWHPLAAKRRRKGETPATAAATEHDTSAAVAGSPRRPVPPTTAMTSTPSTPMPAFAHTPGVAAPLESPSASVAGVAPAGDDRSPDANSRGPSLEQDPRGQYPDGEGEGDDGQLYLSSTPRFKDRLRKDNHKEVERRRRETINEGIYEIANMVPGCEKNKGQIIARAVQYIQQLKENEATNIEKWTLEKLLTDNAIQELHSQIETLRRENERLRMKCGETSEGGADEK